jgi:hypothetical protein
VVHVPHTDRVDQTQPHQMRAEPAHLRRHRLTGCRVTTRSVPTGCRPKPARAATAE